MQSQGVPPSSRRAAVFLDRDDTLIANREVTASTAHPGDLCDPALVRLLPGVREGLRRLALRGYALVVVSNQGCVARGVCTLGQVHDCNERLRELLRAGEGGRPGVELDAVYVCPYHPEGRVPGFSIEHPWRKPAPGMLLQAAKDLDLDLHRSWMIGDSARDRDAAINAGIPGERTIIVDGLSGFARAVDRVIQGA